MGQASNRLLDLRRGAGRWPRLPSREPRGTSRRRATGREGYLANAPAVCGLSGVPGLAPHDLRRTCAKLCRAAGGELEQIQMLLGHASVQTTEKYLGTKQNLIRAPNDAIQ